MRLSHILHDTPAPRRLPLAALLLGGLLSVGTIAAAAERAEPRPLTRKPPVMPERCPGLLKGGEIDKDIEVRASKIEPNADGTGGGWAGSAEIGYVILRYDVGADGVPHNISVDRASADCFRAPSIASLEQWRYAENDPQFGLETMMRYRITFEPGEKPEDVIREMAR